MKTKEMQKVAIYQNEKVKVKVYFNAQHCLNYIKRNADNTEEIEQLENLIKQNDTILITQFGNQISLAQFFLSKSLRKGHAKVVTIKGETNRIRKDYGCPGSTAAGWGWSFFYLNDKKWERFYYKKYVSCSF
jgi:hypothetical protein